MPGLLWLHLIYQPDFSFLFILGLRGFLNSVRVQECILKDVCCEPSSLWVVFIRENVGSLMRSKLSLS